MTKLSDEWRTPQWLFNELNQEFNFVIDLCATEKNRKVFNIWSEDYLNDNYLGWYDCHTPIYKDLIKNLTLCAFMNPPYSNPKPFIEKAWEDSKYCKIVCLVKCDPSTKWWATFWDYNITCPWCIRDDQTGFNPHDAARILNCEHCDNGIYYGPKLGCKVRFFSKRIKFNPPLELINNKDIIKKGDKWIWQCRCGGSRFWSCVSENDTYCDFDTCKHNKEVTGAKFPNALIIMDRRNV